MACHFERGKFGLNEYGEPVSARIEHRDRLTLSRLGSEIAVLSKGIVVVLVDGNQDDRPPFVGVFALSAAALLIVSPRSFTCSPRACICD